MSDEKNRSTETSAFGTPGHTSHDASRFYNSRMYENLPDPDPLPYHENPVPAVTLDQIFCKSSENMDELPDDSVHLMVTSPPYNAQKEYDQDLTLMEYLAMLERVFAETYRVLVPGGRACINIANLGRKPYLPLHSFIIDLMLDLGFLMRGEIIWNKAASASPSTAWGSWLSASNPVLRDVHEYILVFCKGGFKRPQGEARKHHPKGRFFSLDQVRLEFSRRAGAQNWAPRALPGGITSSLHSTVYLFRRYRPGSLCRQRFHRHRRPG